MCEKERKTGCNSDPLQLFACLFCTFPSFRVFSPIFHHFCTHFPSSLSHPSHTIACIHHTYTGPLPCLCHSLLSSLPAPPSYAIISHPLACIFLLSSHRRGGGGANSNWVDLPPLFCHFCEACCLILRCNPCPLFDSYHVGILSCLLLIKRDCKTNLEVDLNLYALPIPQVSYGT